MSHNNSIRPAADIERLELLAAQLRLNIVRMMGTGKAHHFGGSLSCADLICALYFGKMRYDTTQPRWLARDRFIMSKGHSVPAQYAALAMAGFFPVEELPTLKQMGSRLQGHPAMHYTPGLEGCTGSLGQGLSFANGMALAGKIRKLDYHVYCLIGDGELHEGQIWETAIIDNNGLKAMDACTCGKRLEPLAKRWAHFGWQVREIDGHDMSQICQALDWATTVERSPTVILAHTVKGKGISFIENQAGFHNASMNSRQFSQAIAELDADQRKKEEAAR